VFAAEWGDATQIGSAALVAHLKAPLQVFLGATLGLWAGAALAVTIGRALGSRIPQKLLRSCAGVLFCIFGVIAAVRVFRH
jgi:putative Ca2+/H+ antiporter (TMEM165/GDT1 family)